MGQRRHRPKTEHGPAGRQQRQVERGAIIGRYRVSIAQILADTLYECAFRRIIIKEVLGDMDRTGLIDAPYCRKKGDGSGAAGKAGRLQVEEGHTLRVCDPVRQAS